jgi:hypothetical protein
MIYELEGLPFIMMKSILAPVGVTVEAASHLFKFQVAALAMGAAPPETGKWQRWAQAPVQVGRTNQRCIPAVWLLPRNGRPSRCGFVYSLQVAPTHRVRPWNSRLTGAMCTTRTRRG